MLYLILLKSLFFENIACDGFFKGTAPKKTQKDSGILPNSPLSPNIQFDFLGQKLNLNIFFIIIILTRFSDPKKMFFLSNLVHPSVFFYFCVLKKSTALWI